MSVGDLGIMTRTLRLLSLLVTSTGLMFLGDRHSLSSSSTPLRQFLPVIRHGSSKTANWAGYVAATGLAKPVKHSVTDIQGSWRVPTVVASGTLNTASAIWVGIDGGFNRTVEQIGTEQDWTGGAPVYYAWFEMYPARGYMLTAFPIHAGDQISAEVQFIAKNKFVLSISNLTQNVGFSITKKRAAQRTSAEWIVEAPFFRRILDLADFGSMSFSGCSTTMEGIEGAIDDGSWQNEGLTMENPSTSTTLAQPSGLTGGGTGFTVIWHHS
jgi:Peptidase A4 family